VAAQASAGLTWAEFDVLLDAPAGSFLQKTEEQLAKSELEFQRILNPSDSQYSDAIAKAEVILAAEEAQKRDLVARERAAHAQAKRIVALEASGDGRQDSEDSGDGSQESVGNSAGFKQRWKGPRRQTKKRPRGQTKKRPRGQEDDGPTKTKKKRVDTIQEEAEEGDGVELLAEVASVASELGSEFAVKVSPEELQAAVEAVRKRIRTEARQEKDEEQARERGEEAGLHNPYDAMGDEEYERKLGDFIKAEDAKDNQCGKRWTMRQMKLLIHCVRQVMPLTGCRADEDSRNDWLRVERLYAKVAGPRAWTPRDAEACHNKWKMGPPQEWARTLTGNYHRNSFVKERRCRLFKEWIDLKTELDETRTKDAATVGAGAYGKSAVGLVRWQDAHGTMMAQAALEKKLARAQQKKATATKSVPEDDEEFADDTALEVVAEVADVVAEGTEVPATAAAAAPASQSGRRSQGLKLTLKQKAPFLGTNLYPLFSEPCTGSRPMSQQAADLETSTTRRPGNPDRQRDLADKRNREKRYREIIERPTQARTQLSAEEMMEEAKQRHLERETKIYEYAHQQISARTALAGDTPEKAAARAMVNADMSKKLAQEKARHEAEMSALQGEQKEEEG